jgi:hypothetical protein
MFVFLNRETDSREHQIVPFARAPDNGWYIMEHRVKHNHTMTKNCGKRGVSGVVHGNISEPRRVDGHRGSAAGSATAIEMGRDLVLPAGDT